MTSTNFSRALDAYARHSSDPAYFWKYGPSEDRDIAARLQAHLFDPTAHDDHAYSREVPSPAHVAAFLIAPTIAAAGVTDPAEIADLAAECLNGVRKRTNGGSRYAADRNQFSDDPTDVYDLSPWYKGLYRALSHASASPHFTRSRYLADIGKATLREVQRLTRAEAAIAREEAATQARTAAREARAAARPPALSASDRRRKSDASLAERRRLTVRHWLGVLIEDPDTDRRISRADLAEAVLDEVNASARRYDTWRAEVAQARADYDRAAAARVEAIRAWHAEGSTDARPLPLPSYRPPQGMTWSDRAGDAPADFAPVAVGPRQVVSLINELTEELGIQPYRTRTERGYILPEQPPETADTTEEQPLNIETMRKEAAAVRDLADAYRDLTAAQDAAYFSGDRLVALQLQRERLRTGPAPLADLPVNVTPLPARRAA